jgi:hypothetical protein
MSAAMIAKAERRGKHESADSGVKTFEIGVMSGCGARTISAGRPQPKERTKLSARSCGVINHVTCRVRTDW